MSVLENNEQTIGLVVLNYNDADETLRFLDNARELESIAAIQVVDNASSDDSPVLIEDYCSRLESSRIDYSQADSNRGYGAGNNYGVRELANVIHCDYIIIANPDTSITDKTIRSLASFLRCNPEYAAVAPLMMKPSGEVCRSAWKLPDKADMLCNAFRLFFSCIK